VLPGTDDLLKSGLGAVIGFALAQLVNLVKFFHQRFARPRLAIENSGDFQILSHSTPMENGEYYDEKRYGFYVCNTGRRIATGIRFQLLKIEFKRKEDLTFNVASHRCFDLAVYSESSDKRGDFETSLVPGARALIALAEWREDHDALMPSVREFLIITRKFVEELELIDSPLLHSMVLANSLKRK
jgi:hypothetical protein